MRRHAEYVEDEALQKELATHFESDLQLFAHAQVLAKLQQQRIML
jgi:hypothetical protein